MNWFRKTKVIDFKNVKGCKASKTKEYSNSIQMFKQYLFQSVVMVIVLRLLEFLNA